jgi:hypothetical protein
MRAFIVKSFLIISKEYGKKKNNQKVWFNLGSGAKV